VFAFFPRRPISRLQVSYEKTPGRSGLDVLADCCRHPRRIESGRERSRKASLVSDGDLWLTFGILASLLPGLLILRTLMHVLNVDFPGSRRY
jgi:hypothetical protein